MSFHNTTHNDYVHLCINGQQTEKIGFNYSHRHVHMKKTTTKFLLHDMKVETALPLIPIHIYSRGMFSKQKEKANIRLGCCFLFQMTKYFWEHLQNFELNRKKSYIKDGNSKWKRLLLKLYAALIALMHYCPYAFRLGKMSSIYIYLVSMRKKLYSKFNSMWNEKIILIPNLQLQKKIIQKYIFSSFSFSFLIFNYFNFL